MLRRIFNSRQLLQRWRGLSDSSVLTEGELKLKGILEVKFPKATAIQVQDVSDENASGKSFVWIIGANTNFPQSGCGAMYEVRIESEEFSGKRTLQQHRMVTQALAEEVKQMHGLRISTSTPPKSTTDAR